MVNKRYVLCSRRVTMATTVRVSEETRDRLDRYMESVGVTSYEEAITRLLRGTETESAFGSMPGWGRWSKLDRFRSRSDDSAG